MNIETFRALCLSFPGVTEDIKWEHDLCFLVAEKMFCVTDLENDSGASFKVLEEEFEEMVTREGIIPAPYLARNKWVFVLDFSRITDAEWSHYVRQSYELVKSKLPKKVKENL